MVGLPTCSVIVPKAIPNTKDGVASTPTSVGSAVSFSMEVFSPTSRVVPSTYVFPTMEVAQSPATSFDFRDTYVVTSLSAPAPKLPIEAVVSAPVSTTFLTLSAIT